MAAIVLALLAAALLAALAWIAGPGVTLDAADLRVRAAGALGRALGRPVAIDGGLRLHLSLEPRLEVQALRVGADGARDTARIAEARVHVALLPLLVHRRVEIRELHASAVVLERREAVAVPGSGEPAQAGGTARDGSGWRPAGLGIDRIALDSVELRLLGTDGSRHTLALSRVQGSAPPGQPVVLSLMAAVDDRARLAIEASGGSLDAFVDGHDAWPVSLRASMDGTTLTLEGELDAAPAGAGRLAAGRFSFGVGTPDAQSLSPVLRAAVPALGPTSLAGRIRLDGDRVAISELIGTMGESRLDGGIDLAFGRERVRATGRLALSLLDLRPFIMTPAQAGAADGPPAAAGTRTAAPAAGAAVPARSMSIAAWYREMSGARFDLALLRAFDAELDLSVAQWRGLPGDARDARLSLHLEDGRLSAPLAVEFAGVRLDGEIAVDARAEEPGFEFTAGARDSALGDLAEVFFGLPGLRGALGGFAVRASARGDNVAALAASADARVVVARGGFSYGNRRGERPVGFTLDSLLVEVPRGGRVHAEGRGSLLEQPLELSLDAGTVAQVLAEGAVALDATLRSRSASVHLAGSLGQVVAEDARGAFDAQFAVAMRAARARDLAGWLGLAGQGNAAFAADLKLHARAGGGTQAPAATWAIDDARMSLGDTRIEASVAQRIVAGRPRIVAKLHARAVDVDELQALLARAGGETGATRGPALDLPILPDGVDVGEVDLALSADVVRGSSLDIRALSFETQLRGGRMLASPMSMELLGVPLTGALALDMRRGQQHAEWWLQAERADLGALLRRLKLAERVDATFDAVRVHLDARGARLGDILDRSTMTLDVDGGRVVVREPGGRAGVQVALANGRIGAQAGGAVAGALLGALQGEPVALAFTSARLRDLVDPARAVPLHAELSIASARVTLDGSLGRDRAAPDVRFDLSAAGDRLADWQPIAGVTLPEWGPYALAGRLLVGADGYAVDAMQLSIGASRLRGSGRLRTRGAPPRLELALAAPTIQLDDFPLGRWRPFGDAAPAPAGGPPLPADALAAIREKARRASDAERLFGRAALRRFDAKASLRVDEVRAGGDRLGGGSLEFTVEQGRARIGPLRVVLPGGEIRARLGYAPGVETVDVDAELNLDNVDVGVLARRARAGADLAGRVSLELALRSRAPSLARAMAGGNGRLAFRVWPENLRADVFDLWATNLFVALVARLDPQSASRINCGGAEFVLADGRMESRRMLIDTTRVRVSGAGHADFRDEALSLRLSPQPKRAEFFSLATPIRVSGSFADYEIGADAGDVVATGVRLLTSLLWVPLSKLAGTAPPADGADVCAGTGAFFPPPQKRAEAGAPDGQGSAGALEYPGGP